MSDTEWLLLQGFRPVGFWSAATRKVERRTLPDKPGIYAFVVGYSVFYIGRTGKLRRRVPRYNQCLRMERQLAKRSVHLGIAETVAAGDVVDVWVYQHQPNSPETIELLENRWILEKSPEWNDNGV